MPVPGNTPEARIAEAIYKRFEARVAVPGDIAGAEALAMMNERSVCRNYQARPVPEELIRLVCATALTAPSKSDLQQASLIRVSAPERRSAIQAFFSHSAWMASAPEFFVFCGDHSRLQHLFAAREADYPNNHLDSFFNAAVDAAILLATFVQAANFAGLGCCPVSEIRNRIEEISEMLNLPPYVFPIAGLTLGYPVTCEPLSPRIGFGGTLHANSYDATRTGAELDAYDVRRVRDRPYAAQREANRFGEVAHYGWTEEKFRYYSNPQRTNFGAFVRGQGFCLD